MEYILLAFVVICAEGFDYCNWEKKSFTICNNRLKQKLSGLYVNCKDDARYAIDRQILKEGPFQESLQVDFDYIYYLWFKSEPPGLSVDELKVIEIFKTQSNKFAFAANCASHYQILESDTVIKSKLKNLGSYFKANPVNSESQFLLFGAYGHPLLFQGNSQILQTLYNRLIGRRNLDIIQERFKALGDRLDQKLSMGVQENDVQGGCSNTSSILQKIRLFQDIFSGMDERDRSFLIVAILTFIGGIIIIFSLIIALIMRSKSEKACEKCRKRKEKKERRKEGDYLPLRKRNRRRRNI